MNSSLRRTGSLTRTGSVATSASSPSAASPTSVMLSLFQPSDFESSMMVASPVSEQQQRLVNLSKSIRSASSPKEKARLFNESTRVLYKLSRPLDFKESEPSGTIQSGDIDVVVDCIRSSLKNFKAQPALRCRVAMKRFFVAVRLFARLIRQRNTRRHVMLLSIVSWWEALEAQERDALTKDLERPLFHIHHDRVDLMNLRQRVNVPAEEKFAVVKRLYYQQRRASFEIRNDWVKQLTTLEKQLQGLKASAVRLEDGSYKQPWDGDIRILRREYVSLVLKAPPIATFQKESLSLDQLHEARKQFQAIQSRIHRKQMLQEFEEAVRAVEDQRRTLFLEAEAKRERDYQAGAAQRQAVRRAAQLELAQRQQLPPRRRSSATPHSPTNLAAGGAERETTEPSLVRHPHPHRVSISAPAGTAAQGGASAQRRRSSVVVFFDLDGSYRGGAFDSGSPLFKEGEITSPSGGSSSSPLHYIHHHSSFQRQSSLTPLEKLTLPETARDEDPLAYLKKFGVEEHAKERAEKQRRDDERAMMAQLDDDRRVVELLVQRRNQTPTPALEPHLACLGAGEDGRVHVPAKSSVRLRSLAAMNSGSRRWSSGAGGLKRQPSLSSGSPSPSPLYAVGPTNEYHHHHHSSPTDSISSNGRRRRGSGAMEDDGTTTLDARMTPDTHYSEVQEGAVTTTGGGAEGVEVVPAHRPPSSALRLVVPLDEDDDAAQQRLLLPSAAPVCSSSSASSRPLPPPKGPESPFVSTHHCLTDQRILLHHTKNDIITTSRAHGSGASPGATGGGRRSKAASTGATRPTTTIAGGTSSAAHREHVKGEMLRIVKTLQAVGLEPF